MILDQVGARNASASSVLRSGNVVRVTTMSEVCHEL